VIFKQDKLLLGIVLGFLAPALFFVGYYFFKLYPNNVSPQEFWRLLMTQKSFFTGLTSISLIMNAVLFTIYINTNRYQTGKGIFVITLVYGIVVLLVKVIH
jgi:hypothetical protein